MVSYKWEDYFNIGIMWVLPIDLSAGVILTSNFDSDFKCVQQRSSSVAKRILDTSSTIRGFGEEPGLVTICIEILLVGNYNSAQKYFKYSRTQPCKKAWVETNEKYRAQYHTVLTIMIILGKTFG